MPGTIPEAEKTAKILVRKVALETAMDRLAENLYNGRITLGMWEEDMRTRMREYMYGAVAIGKGSPEAVTRSDIGKLGAELKKQYRWVHNFAKDIYAKRDVVTIRAIQARSHLYAEAGHKMATEIQAGYFAPNTRRDPPIILSWMPRDGSTACLNRCGCKWVLEVLGEDKAQGIKTVSATWVLDPEKEHCEDCVPRDGHTEVVEVPIDAAVPAYIGI